MQVKNVGATLGASQRESETGAPPAAHGKTQLREDGANKQELWARSDLRKNDETNEHSETEIRVILKQVILAN